MQSILVNTLKYAFAELSANIILAKKNFGWVSCILYFISLLKEPLGKILVILVSLRYE